MVWRRQADVICDKNGEVTGMWRKFVPADNMVPVVWDIQFKSFGKVIFGKKG